MDKSLPNSKYGTTEQRINTFGQVEDSASVARVFRAVRTIVGANPDLSGEPDKIIKHLLETYGIKIKYLRDPALPTGGGWDMSFEIVDQELYTFFLLKH